MITKQELQTFIDEEFFSGNLKFDEYLLLQERLVLVSEGVKTNLAIGIGTVLATRIGIRLILHLRRKADIKYKNCIISCRKVHPAMEAMERHKCFNKCIDDYKKRKKEIVDKELELKEKEKKSK